MEGHGVIEFLRRVAAPLERLILASAAEGAQTQIFCATSPDAQSGQYYVNCKVARCTPDSRNELAASRLWEETQIWLCAANN
jgi:hypothetical protein